MLNNFINSMVCCLLQHFMVFCVELLWQETHKEFVKWKFMTDHRLTEIMTSLKDVQVSKKYIAITFSSF